MNKRYAQLTEAGWINIQEEIFEVGGLADRQSYAFISTDEDYAGGGCRYYAGVDTPEESIDRLDGYEFGLDDGIEAIWPWPPNIASFAAHQASIYGNEDEDEDEDEVFTVTRALLKMAPADRTE